MVIYLVRHGETDWNRQRRLQGTEDIPLNETGIAQSHACAAVFENIPVELILTSPLQRARVTADIIAGRLKNVPVIVEGGLTERDFGKLSGRPYEDRDTILASGEDLQMEPLEKLIERFMAVLDRYIKDGSYENILVVSHGATINAVLLHLSNGTVGTGKTILKNTCINKLRVQDGGIEIDFFNKTPEEFGMI
jgi:broad specificity phosphatase PhoE